MPVSGAERMRQVRARERAGEMWLPIVVPVRIVEALLDRGWLTDGEASDPARVGAAAVAALADLFEIPMKNSVTRHGGGQGDRRIRGRGGIR